MTLAPAMPLAVVDLAVSTAAAPNAEAFWAAELGYSIAEATTSDTARDGLQRLLERWGTGRVGLAVCGAAGLTEPIAGGVQRRFCATSVGGAVASDALAALQWVLEGFAEGRFERAFLGSVGEAGAAETWLVLVPLAAARALGWRVLATWGEHPAADAVALVTGTRASEGVINAAIAGAIPSEPRGLPARALWIAPGAEGAEAHAVLTACAVAVLAVAYRALPPSRGLDGWDGPRERGFGHFPRPRPWLREPGRTPRTALALVPSERAALAAAFSDADPEGRDPLELPWPAQLFVLSAPSEATLLAEIKALAQRLAEAPSDAAATVAAELWAKPRYKHRCAIVASGTSDLARKLAAASARLQGSSSAPSPRERVLIGASEHAGTPVAFMIPGQGSQYSGMLRELALVSPAVRHILEQLAAILAGNGISLTPLLHLAEGVLGTDLGKKLEDFWREVSGGGLVGCGASQAFQELLSGYNVRPAIFLGHSIGETTALTLAEALGPEPPGHVAGLARSLVALRADLLRLGQTVDDAGIAVSGADRARIDRVLEAHAGRVFLALDNCPHQLVLVGGKRAIEAAAADLRSEGVICVNVWLGAPFHTPLFAGAIANMSAFYDRLGIRAPKVPVWSGARKAPFPADPSEIKALLLQQWTETVRFAAAVRSLHDRGVRVFVEVGPGDTLTGFIDDSLSGRDHLAVACDSQWFGGLEHLLAALGRLFVAGVEVAPSGRAESRTLNQVPAPVPAEAARPARAGHGDAPTIRARHDALLRELEASRARVLGAASARVTVTPERPSSASAFPALGSRRENSGEPTAFERRLTLESDLYLRDHLFGSIRSPRSSDLSALPVVPMVMTLEILAEAALAEVSRERRAAVVAVDRLRLHRWLTLDRGYLDVRVVVRPQPSSEPSLRRAHVELFELDDAAPTGRWSAAEATILLAPSLAPPPSGRRLGGRLIEPRWSPERFVRELVFQGPSLRCFHRLVRMTTEGIEAEVVVPARDQLFRGDPAPMLATAASLMDGAGQVVARWVAEYWPGWYGLYPFSMERYEQFGPLPRPGERLRCIAFVRDDGDVAAADVEFQRPDGAVLFRYRDFRQRRFDMTAELMACIRTYDAEYAFTRPFDAGVGLLGCVFDGGHHDIVRPERAIFLQTIAYTVLTAKEREAWRAIPQGSPRRARWLMGRVAAKEAVRGWAAERHGLSPSAVDIEIQSDERGKPIARFIGGALSIPAPEVSISHADTLAVAVVAEDVAIGVDIEEERAGAPRTVPEIAFADGELAEAARAGVPPIALWCAKEAAAKALGVGLLGEPRRWRVQDLASDGRTAVVSIDGLRLPVTVHRRDRALIAVAHASREVAAKAREGLRVADHSEIKPAL